MKRRLTSMLVAAGLVAAGTGAHAITTFEQNVSTAIDRGIEWLANQGYFNNPVVIDGYDGGFNGATGGLVLLAILERRASGDPGDPPQGYTGASATDQARMRNLAAFLIDRSNEGFGGHETYYVGNYLMGLARYLLTGGPSTGDAGMPPIDGDYPSLLAAIKNYTDILLGNTDASGYFYYTGPPGVASPTLWDSSATQFGVAGLASAKAVFSDPLYPDAGRLAAINTALGNSRTAYANHGAAAANTYNTGSDNGSCSVIDGFERGHGYRASGYRPSLQQTASGTWVQILGGSNVNDTGVQQYLRWLRNHYRWQDLDSMGNSWPTYSYWYYTWSSFKAFEFIADMGIAPAAGNIGPDSIGLLDTAAGTDPTTGAYAACNVRQLRKDPATVAQPAAFGGAAAGVYAGEEAGVYFDYASQIIGHQCYDGSAPIAGTDGEFNCNSTPGDWNGYGRQAYALLVLQRATGGGCVDTDGDTVCDDVDNCRNTPNPGQQDQDGDGVGDVCDNCPTVANPGQEDSNGNGTGDACEGKCDVDKDGDVDKRDTAAISRNRGGTVPPLDQAYDANNDGKVTPADVKVCIPKCTRPNCAIQ